MPSLADLQTAVARTVVAGAAPALPTLVGGVDPPRRLAIHARHYERSLATALESKFPATRWLVGQAAFAAEANGYVHSRPPRAPCLAEYGADFPTYLAEGRSLRSLPYLRAFAELEWTVGQVSIAVDSPSLGWGEVGRVGPEALIDCQASTQPGLRYLRTEWPVDALLKCWLAGTQPRTFVIERAVLHIEVRGARGEFRLERLTPARFTFRQALQAGHLVGDAAEQAFLCDAGFDAGEALRETVAAGLVTALRATPTGSAR